ncbi:retropepsin-like aspartic protease [Actinomadura alba]|uniref:Clan AA aspartic protease n=1 Tax=Actinomadura alba TaxID=406431 RepID=A0ABR7LKE6_9ACTN|nr:retropepsin-like aspartic protease [Actinomadura alba]MBC6465317.1 clan AA aspartic protease [Actinomadura alba]
MRARWAAPVLVVALTLGMGGYETEPAYSVVSALGDSRMARPRAEGGFTVPIRVVTERGATIVFVQVMVNGRGPFDFILDTGASSSSVDRSLVQQLQLPPTGATAHVQGIAGEALAPVVRIRVWTLGGQVLRSRAMPVFELGDSRVAGLLGSDELRRFGAVTVDYRRQRLTLHNTGR